MPFKSPLVAKNVKTDPERRIQTFDVADRIVQVDSSNTSNKKSAKMAAGSTEEKVFLAMS